MRARDASGRRPAWRAGRWLALLLALALLAWGPARADGPPAEAAQAAAGVCPPPPRPHTVDERERARADAPDRGLLWRVERGGRVSHLYATVHIGRRDWVWPGPTVRAALEASDRLALELDLLDPDVLARLQRAAAAPPGRAGLPDALASRLAQAVSRACAEEMLDGLRPELQVLTLATLDLRGEGYDPAWGIDAWLARLAHERRMRVVSLETPEQQLALLAGGRPGDTERAVQRGLDELATPASRAVMRRLLQAWADGRLDELASLPEWCACLDTPEDRAQHALTVDRRNLPMADRIAAMHDRGLRVFAAVGALHMVGPQGLPALLARRGFRVEPVLPAPPSRP